MSTMSSAPGDRAETADETERHENPSPAEMAAQQGVPARGASHYAKGTSANMIRSMAVIIAITLALFFVAGRPNSRTPQSVDVPGSAQYRADEAGQPFAYPDNLPEGWVATSVRYVRSKGGVMVWNAGYATPDGEYVSIQQALDPDAELIRVQTNGAAPDGTLTTKDGRDWVKRDREGKVQRSLVYDPKSPRELTTLVTGTGSWEQLEDFTNRLTKANPAKGTSAA